MSNVAAAFGSDARLLTVTPELRRQLTDALCEGAAPAVKAWASPTQLADGFREHVAGLVERAESTELAKRFAEDFPVAGAVADDYRNFVVELPSDLRLVTGIRFRGLDSNAPFVDVAWQSRPLRDERELRDVITRVARAYQYLRPRYVQFWTNMAGPFEPSSSTGVVVDRYVVAGLVKDVARAQVAHVERVSIVPVRTVDFFRGYLAEYAAFQARRPDLADAARAESLESLRACAEQGTLFRVHVAGELAGVTGWRRATCDGLDGYCVVELLLYAAFRGRELAPAVHVQTCRQPGVEPERALFGSIAAHNLPSLKTARRVGRHIISAKVRAPVTA